MCSLTRTISEECLGAVPATGPRPGSIGISLRCRAFNCFFETTPVLLESNAAATTLLYRNVSYLWQDVVEQAGVFAAQTPLRLFGTTEHRETAEMDFFQQDTVLMARRRSASGREFDHLQGLALQAQWPDAALAQNMTCPGPQPFQLPGMLRRIRASRGNPANRRTAPPHSRQSVRLSYLATRFFPGSFALLGRGTPDTTLDTVFDGRPSKSGIRLALVLLLPRWPFVSAGMGVDAAHCAGTAGISHGAKTKYIPPAGSGGPRATL